MEPDNQDKPSSSIIVKNNATPMKRLLIILFAPAILLVAYVRHYARSNFYRLPTWDELLGFSLLGIPLSFVISYAMWKDLETKVILTNKTITRKQPLSRQLHIEWNNLKEIRIASERKGIQITFKKKKPNFMSNHHNQIQCPPGFMFRRKGLPKGAAALILEKIDMYEIPIKGKREYLEEIAGLS